MIKSLRNKMTSVRWAFNFGAWNPSKEEWVLASQVIQDDEKERIGRFMFQRDAKAAMSGRLLLRKVIAYSLGIPYKDIQLGRTEKGKPYLLNTGVPELSFNISHQGDYAVLAAEANHTVGIDVMKIEYPRGSKSVTDFFRHMYRQFTDQEWTKIRSTPNEWEQLGAFYRNWCLKESYVKALGQGLGFSLQRADFHTSSALYPGQVTTDTVMLVDNLIQEDYVFQETMLDDKHTVAVAMQRSPTGPRTLPHIPLFYCVTIDELLEGTQAQLPPDESFWTSFSLKQAKPM